MGRRKGHLKSGLRKDPDEEPYSGMPQLVAAVIPSKNVHNRIPVATQSQSRLPPKSPISRLLQQRIFCSVCAKEMDSKPVVGPTPTDNQDINSPPPIIGFANPAEQVSLDALCTLGHHGHGNSISKFFLDKNTPCQLCQECFGIVEDIREIKQNMDLLNSELTSRVAAMRALVEESPLKFERKRGRLPNDLAKLKQIQKVLGKAFGQERLPNPAARICSCRNLNGSEEQVASTRGDGLVKQESKLTINHNSAEAIGIKNEPISRPKRKYVKREIKYESELSDEDYSPKKQPSREKRKYVRRKPLLESKDAVIDVENDLDDDFVIPIIKCVKTESNIPAGPFLSDTEHVQWLTENVEVADKGVILRSTLYQHFLEHCALIGRLPLNQASFGKLVKSVFRGFVGCRRLGSRGRSMYCHIGLRIKDDSPLNDVIEQYDVEDSNSTRRDVVPRRKPRGVLKELGIRVPPKLHPHQIPPDTAFSTALFTSVIASGQQAGGFGPLQFLPPLPLDLDSSLNIQSASDDQPVENILRTLMS